MKRTGSIKFLVAVAIVSSATVMQIRAHIAAPDVDAPRSQATMSRCGSEQGGITPASCGPMQRERQSEPSQPPQNARQLWV